MDMNPENAHICICGRTFANYGALNCHKFSCTRTKKRLSGALAKAKEVWNSRKRRRVEVLELERADHGVNQDMALAVDANCDGVDLQAEVRYLFIEVAAIDLQPTAESI